MLLLLCLSAIPACAQRDTAYLKSYYTKLVPRLIYTYTTQDFYFSSRADGVTTSTSFHTGNQLSIGADISYKWVGLSYSFSLTPDQSRHNSSFRFSTAHRGLQFQLSYSLLQNLNYSVTKEQNGDVQDTLLSSRENNIAILTARLKLDYVFNYRKYSYSAGFSQSGKQRKSAGSPIASIAFSNSNFALNQLSAPARVLFDSLNGFTQTIITGLDVGAGYGYTWVLGKYWSLAVTDVPNAEFQLVTGQTINPEAYYTAIGFINHFRGGAMYSRGQWAIGLSAYNISGTSKMKRSNYSNIYNSVDVYIGWLIDTRRKLLYLF